MKNLAVFLVLVAVSASAVFVLWPQETIPPKLEQIEISQKTEQEILAEIDQKNQEYLHGMYITTVYNLDYPSQTNLSEKQLKAEMDAMLDDTQNMGITDVFFQVRPQADAFYVSEIFPTSVYLTGNQDSPAPFDVLEYVTQGCHERGMKIHAWINPYRITKKETDILSSAHIAVTEPDRVVKHTDGNLYFDPALQQNQQLIIDSILEIIENYDVDGIHFDDYFYPDTDFDDSQSYALYGDGKSLGDFRRDNVTELVENTYNAVKSADETVQFGISPAGIWGNSSDISGGSETGGSQSYFRQYADTKKWVEYGIIDYIAPQIYWAFGHKLADFQTLCDWWDNVVAGTDVKLYIAHANYNEYSGVFDAGEIQKQLEYSMAKENVHGSLYFRYKLIGDTLN